MPSAGTPSVPLRFGPDGLLYVPNDNFFVYALDRDTGEVSWSQRVDPHVAAGQEL